MDSGDGSIIYKADGSDISASRDGWTPSIHMPRWASRITLEIVSVRVERVQEISGEDSEAEGVGPVYEGSTLRHAKDDKLTAAVYKNQFAKLWDSINAKRGLGWSVNPYVFVLEFRKL